MINSLKFQIKRYLRNRWYGEKLLRYIRVFLKHTHMLSNKLRKLLRKLLGKVDTLYLDVTHACNLRCVSCYTNAGVKKDDELTIEEQKSVIRQAKKMGAQFVSICGSGEPLLYKDILTLVDYIRKLEMGVAIFTNGTLLTKEVVDFLVSREVRIGFKLWSLDPNIVEQMIGGINVYKWVDYSYRYNGTLKSLKIPSGLKYLFDATQIKKREYLIIELLIAKINYSTIPKLIQFCKEMNLQLWLETPVFSGRAIENYKDLILSSDEYRSLYYRLVEILGEEYFESYRNQPCIVEKGPVVFVNGEVGFCSSRGGCIGNVRNTPLNLLFAKAKKLKCKEDCLIAQSKVDSQYFRTCRGRQYYEAKYGLFCYY